MLLSVKILPMMACIFTLVSSQNDCLQITLNQTKCCTNVSDILQQLQVQVSNLEKKIEDLTDAIIQPLPMDCEDVRDQKQEATIESGLFLVGVPGLLKRRIYCNFTENETWTTIQRRIHEEDIFNKNWTEYKNGFGKANGDYWIGNEMLHLLTKKRSYYLRITMDGGLIGKKISSYKSFKVEDEGSEYHLRLGEYDGENSNGGDSFFPVNADCNKGGHTHATFSTYDQGRAKKCSKTLTGGWWFTDCGCSNLNGKYVRGGSVPTSGPNIGLYWDTIYRDRWGLKSSLRKVTMEIRRIKTNQNNNQKPLSG